MGNYDYASYVDLELTWGPEFSEILVERGRMPKNKIVPCGPFTLDASFHKPPVHHAGKKVLLFATAWSAADDDPAYTECGVPADSPLQTELYRLHRWGRDEWIRAIQNLHLTKSHKYEFVLKVRPGERTAEYIEKLGKFVRVLPYEFPSADAIAMSDCVIHAGSTMAIEAHLVGVPSINYCNCNADLRLVQVASMCRDLAELNEALGRMHWGHSNIDPAGYQWLVDHLYGPVDGHACERAAEAIDEVVRPWQEMHAHHAGRLAARGPVPQRPDERQGRQGLRPRHLRRLQRPLRNQGYGDVDLLSLLRSDAPQGDRGRRQGIPLTTFLLGGE